MCARHSSRCSSSNPCVPPRQGTKVPLLVGPAFPLPSPPHKENDMKFIIRSAVLASVCALGLTTLPAPAADKVTLNAEVASSVRPPFEQFIKIYEKKHPNTTITAKYLGGGVIQADV